jgi:hypothetical protein
MAEMTTKIRHYEKYPMYKMQRANHPGHRVHIYVGNIVGLAVGGEPVVETAPVTVYCLDCLVRSMDSNIGVDKRQMMLMETNGG